MEGYGPAALAFAVAALITALELVTTQYARSGRFVLRSVWFYVYAGMYGVAAVILFAILPDLPETVTFAGVSADNPWVQAALVGITIKALLHIRIFSVSTGPGKTVPVGLETLVQVLGEPSMLRGIELDHFNGLMSFIEPRGEKYTLDEARQKAKANIPNSFSGAEKTAFQVDLDQAETSVQVLQRYVDYVGLKTVQRVFR
ncbi:MAG TPA: hypothetical protein VHG92_14320 [Afifellaceae bacterium]|nr:hypothetical protein [Afifellaceae bacterium]